MKIQTSKPTFAPITITIESNSELLALITAANVNQQARIDDLFSSMRDSITDDCKNVASTASRNFSDKIFDALVPKSSSIRPMAFNTLVADLISKIKAGE